MRDVLHREVELPCSIKEAWEHVVDPSWLGEEGSLDLSPGGEGWVGDEQQTKYLIVEEVEDERHLVYRWASFTDEPTRVEIDLEPIPEGTRISIAESPLTARAQASLGVR